MNTNLIQVSIQPEKREILFKESAYLDHIIGSEVVKPDPKKIEAVRIFSTPKNPRSIKEFLGLAGYYGRFDKDFAAKKKPSANLVKKGVSFIWGPAEEKSLLHLRQTLLESPIIKYKNFQKPFNITTTDASGYAVNAVFMKV